MSPEISKYIAFRYPNWMDYARHQCRVQHLDGWADDLLNDMIADLLSKPEEKLADLISRPTRKIVNGQPTTELDKFMLKMIKMNAVSKYAAFRKNTVGQKIIATGATVEVATFTELNQTMDMPDETTYNANRAAKLDRMHTLNINKLMNAGFPAWVIQKYREHYIESKPITTNKDRKIIESVTEVLTSKSRTLCLSK